MKYRFIFSLMLLFAAVTIPVTAQWTRVTEVNEMAYSFARTVTTLYVGGDYHVFRSEDGGENWTTSSSFPDDAEGVFALATWRDMLFAGTAAHGVFSSSDHGLSWQRFGSNDPRFTITTLLVFGDTLYAGTDGWGVFAVGLENPGVWREVNEGLYWRYSYSINTLYATQTHIYAGAGFNGHIFSREVGTESWTEVLVDEHIASDLTAYAFQVYGDALLLGGNAGIHRGALDGTQWSHVGVASLPFYDVIAFALHEGNLYAGVQHGGEYFIAKSFDGGGSWVVTDHEFAMLFGITEYADKLYAAREDGLHWKQVEGTQSSDPVVAPGTVRITGLYPQPASGPSTVGFSLDAPGHVAITVVDMLGRVVATVTDGRVEAGTHMRSVDATALPNGAYILRLESAGVLDARVFTVAR